MKDLLCISVLPNDEWAEKHNAATPFKRGEKYDLKSVEEFVNSKCTNGYEWYVTTDSNWFADEDEYPKVADLITEEQAEEVVEVSFEDPDDEFTSYSPVFFAYVSK